MGITALISTLLGLVGGVVPDILKEVRESRAATRERELLQLTHTMQIERMKFEAGAKLREAEAGIMAEEVRAIREQVVAAITAGARPSGIVWIDGLNALIRPTASLLILILFVISAGAFVAAVLQQYAEGGDMRRAVDLGSVLWSSQIGFAVEAVFGFLFGARQVKKLLG